MTTSRLLERWQAPEFVGEFNRFGRPSRDPVAVTPDSSERGGTVIVEVIADGTPIGSASWRGVRYGPNPESLAWNIGINLIPAGEARGMARRHSACSSSSYSRPLR